MPEYDEIMSEKERKREYPLTPRQKKAILTQAGIEIVEPKHKKRIGERVQDLKVGLEKFHQQASSIATKIEGIDKKYSGGSQNNHMLDMGTPDFNLNEGSNMDIDLGGSKRKGKKKTKKKKRDTDFGLNFNQKW